MPSWPRHRCGRIVKRLSIQMRPTAVACTMLQYRLTRGWFYRKGRSPQSSLLPQMFWPTGHLVLRPVKERATVQPWLFPCLDLLRSEWEPWGTRDDATTDTSRNAA